MSKISCDVMGDLLPLYVDDVVSEDTRHLVEEHLSSCSTCQAKLDEMRQPVRLPDFQDVQAQDAQTLKGLKKRLRHRRHRTAACSVLLTAALFLVIWALRQPRSVDQVLDRITAPFAVGEEITRQEVDDGLTLVLYRSQEAQSHLQGALIRKQGPFYRLIRCSGSLKLEPVGRPEPGELRSQALISWYDRDDPEKCAVLAVALDEEVDRIDYCGTQLNKVEFDGCRVFFGIASGDYELYQLYDEAGRELDHYAE